VHAQLLSKTYQALTAPSAELVGTEYGAGCVGYLFSGLLGKCSSSRCLLNAILD
jgi:hypothetical protein